MVSLLLAVFAFPVWNEPPRSPSTFWINFIVSGLRQRIKHGGTGCAYVPKFQPRKSGTPRNLQGEAADSTPTRGQPPALRRQLWRWVSGASANLCNCLLGGVTPGWSALSIRLSNETPWTVSLLTSMFCVTAVETVDSVNQKNDPLLALLKSVYVESNDPAAEVRLGHLAVCMCVTGSDDGWCFVEFNSRLMASQVYLVIRLVWHWEQSSPLSLLTPLPQLSEAAAAGWVCRYSWVKLSHCCYFA